MKNKVISFVPGVSRVISNITPVIILFVFSKFIPTEELGLLNYFISIITLISVFSAFGLPEAIQKFLPGNTSKETQSNLIFPTLGLEFILVTLVAIVFAIADLLSGAQLTYNHTLLIFLILISSSSNVVILTFNGLQRNIRTSTYFIGCSLAFVILTFLFYFSGMTNVVDAFLWGRLISWALFIIIPLADLYHNKFLTRFYKLPRRFLTFAANNFLIIFSYSLFNQWDSILITNTLGNYTNGVYKSVAFLASMPYVISVVINTKLLPEYSKLHSEGKNEEIRQSFLSYTKLLIAGSIVLTILSIPLSHLGVSIVYNTEIADQGSFYLPLILLAVLIYVIAIPAVSLLQAMGKEAIVRNASLLQGIGFVVLSTLLLPRFGLIILPIILMILNGSFFAINFYNARKID